MKTSIKLHITILVILTLSIVSSSAQGVLFKIERSKDANEVIYLLNLEKGNKLNLQDPIQVFWLKRTENNKYKPLTWIQQNFAYGLVYLEKNDSYAKFHFAGYNGRIFELKKNEYGHYKVYTSFENKVIEVTRIFIQIDGGSFWIPIIPYVELIGYDISSFRLLTQKIKP